jgi:Uma2 family endonuclease
MVSDSGRVHLLTANAPERFPEQPPLLWIEIPSEDDQTLKVWAKADELIENGVSYFWIIDPHTLKSELRSKAGITNVEEKTLRLPNTEIAIPLLDVVQE